MDKFLIAVDARAKLDSVIADLEDRKFQLEMYHPEQFEKIKTLESHVNKIQFAIRVITELNEDLCDQ